MHFRNRLHYGLNVCPPPPPKKNSCVEFLMPNMMESEGGAYSGERGVDGDD